MIDDDYGGDEAVDAGSGGTAAKGSGGEEEEEWRWEYSKQRFGRGFIGERVCLPRLRRQKLTDVR